MLFCVVVGVDIAQRSARAATFHPSDARPGMISTPAEAPQTASVKRANRRRNARGSLGPRVGALAGA